jgi:flavin reductase (DIM6/NTAB) family NADH-FMN oxidoreductase RutF
MSEWFVEAANHCCGDFPPDVDELELSGLTSLPALHCKAPLIGESGVNMECKVSATTCSMYYVQALCNHFKYMCCVLRFLCMYTCLYSVSVSKSAASAI